VVQVKREGDDVLAATEGTATVKFIALKYIALFVCLTGVWGVSCAQAEEWANRMFDNQLEYDFGDLAKGAKAEYRFKIKNRFEEDIHITSVKSSCGCTAPKLSKKVLATGEEAELIVDFDTVKFKGSHAATITVEFAPPFSAEVRLQVKGFVRQDVVFNPGRIEFGQVPADEGATENVAVTYAGRENWEIADVRSANANFEVRLREPSRSNGRVEYDMQVRLKKTAPTGYIKDQLTLVTNDQSHQYIPITVEANVVPSVSVSPTSLHLGVVRPGESVTKQLVVRGTSPFRILDVACEQQKEGSAEAIDCFKFAPGEQHRKLHIIPVTFTANDSTGKIIETIQITTDAGPDSNPPTPATQPLKVVAHVEVLDE
jgi:hypothetical protein